MRFASIQIKLDIFQDHRLSSLFTSNLDLDRLCRARVSILQIECDKCPATPFPVGNIEKVFTVSYGYSIFKGEPMLAVRFFSAV